MSDVSGIPNMGFGGGSYFGGNAATGQPAWSAAQINASMGLPQAQAAQSQAFANLYGGGSFGAQPAYYAALGASYGRQVPGSIDARVQAARAYNAQRTGQVYNTPTSYGSMHNEGAPAPAAPSYYPMGQFRPQTYGWDHNEGAQPSYYNMFNPSQMGPSSWTPAPQPNFNDRFIHPAPRQIESPYGPGGYPPMAPATPGQQSSNTNWYGMPTASS